jgi:hypothetical protein
MVNISTTKFTTQDKIYIRLKGLWIDISFTPIPIYMNYVNNEHFRFKTCKVTNRKVLIIWFSLFIFESVIIINTENRNNNVK